MLDYREEMISLAQEIDEMRYEPSEWEAEFLDSILDRLHGGRDLTPKQEAALRNMYAKYDEWGKL